MHTARVTTEDRASSEAWERSFAELQTHVQINGHSRVPRSYRTGAGFCLGMWVANQRRAYRDAALGEEQVRRLERLPGWVWEPYDERWDAMFCAAAEHLESGSEIPAALVSDEGLAIGAWCGTQRRAYRNGQLSPERIAALEALPGWVWSQRPSAEDTGIEELERFIGQHGHSAVPSTYVTGSGFRLGAWLQRQSREIKTGRIPLGRYQKLQALLAKAATRSTETEESA